MASKLTRTTTDHDEIRRWAEERGARPADAERGGATGIIRRSTTRRSTSTSKSARGGARRTSRRSTRGRR